MPTHTSARLEVTIAPESTQLGMGALRTPHGGLRADFTDHCVHLAHDADANADADGAVLMLMHGAGADAAADGDDGVGDNYGDGNGDGDEGGCRCLPSAQERQGRKTAADDGQTFPSWSTS